MCLVVIRVIITTTLKCPAAVGEAQIMEPDDGGLDPHFVNIRFHQSASSAPSMRYNMTENQYAVGQQGSVADAFTGQATAATVSYIDDPESTRTA